MFAPYEIWVGLRYTLSGRRNRFVSFISLLSVLGLALGVTALITVLSVMNGFERELRDRILGMAAHATVTELDGRLANWPTVLERASKFDGVTAVAPFVQGEVMLTRGRAVRGALVRGVLPDREREVLEIEQYMTHGSLDALRAGEFNVVLGATLARALGAAPGGSITLIAPQATVSPAGVLPRLRRFKVVGLFEVEHQQYDAGVALVHMDDAARLLRLGDKVSGVRLMTEELYAAPRIARDLASSLGGAYWVRDWTQHHANFFRALRIEKTVMFVILSLIVAVAAFNIVATLVMVVEEKRGDIAILRTIGTTPFGIMLVFVVQGIFIGLLGTLLGLVGGVLLASYIDVIVPAIERFTGNRFLSPEIYFLTQVPSDLRLSDVGAIATVAFVLCVLATLYPALRAGRTAPAQALRYE